jgi:hypothetical protein
LPSCAYGVKREGVSRRLPLADHSEDVALLRDIWDDPSRRDRRGIATAVTKEIAGKLGELAAALEDQGHDQEQVARFLMRCVFTLFAEDVDLLVGEPFRQLLEEAKAQPHEFVTMAESLWRAMDRGERFGLRRLLRFNGHFFRGRHGHSPHRGASSAAL